MDALGSGAASRIEACFDAELVHLDVGGMLWVQGSNETGTAVDIAGRALKVSASLQANWQTVQVQVLMIGGGVDGGLRGLAFYPLLSTT